MWAARNSLISRCHGTGWDASGFFEFADEVDPFHPTDNSATRRIPGISPLVRSR
jgi:hypothetical protein